MRGSNKPILATVAFICFVDMLGFGLMLPVMPRLIGEISHTNLGRAAEIGGMLMFAYAGMQFLFAPIIGGLSDRFGRRPVLLTTLFLLGIDYAIMALAPSLAWLVAGRLMSGIMGASWAASNSCVADCVEPDERGAAFGLLLGAGGIGFVLGPAIGGLASELGTRVPFMLASGLAFAGTMVGLILLKETLPFDRRRRFELARANPLGSITQMAKTPFVLACLFVVFFMQFSAQAHLSIWAFWGELQFGWTPTISGLTVSLFAILTGIGQAMLTGRSIKRFGAAATAKYTLLFGLPSYFLLAIATSTPIVLLAILLGAVTGMTSPAIQTLMSVRISEDAQGELQGAIASMIGLASIIGPIAMTQIFVQFADYRGVHFPGAPYLLSIALLMIAIWILWLTLAKNVHGELGKPSGLQPPTS